MLRWIAVTTLAMGFALAEASVPKGATEIEPGVYKHTDAAGKTFIFRKTPFGIVKSAEQPVASDKSSAQPETPRHEAKSATDTTATPFGGVNKPTKSQEVKVVDRGEMLEFERPSPFGSYKWKAKKSELTAEEREAWAKARGQESPAKGEGPKE